MGKSKEAPDQHAEFVKAARELGTDESEEAFDKMLGKIASAPPPETIQQRKDAMQRRKKMVQDSREAAAKQRAARPAGKKPKRK